eukprot:Selendium_serpulae@DN272_c0_g1_i1.p1
MIGTSSPWQTFHNKFESVLAGYIERGLFVGDDRPIFQSICSQNPEICGFLTPEHHSLDAHNRRVWGLGNVLHNERQRHFRYYAHLFWLPQPRPLRPISPNGSQGVVCALVIDDHSDYSYWRWAAHHRRLGLDVVLHHNSLRPIDHQIEHQTSNSPSDWAPAIAFPPPQGCCADGSTRCVVCRQCASQDQLADGSRVAVCQYAVVADCLYRYAEKYGWVGSWGVGEYVFPSS